MSKATPSSGLKRRLEDDGDNDDEISDMSRAEGDVSGASDANSSIVSPNEKPPFILERNLVPKIIHVSLSQDWRLESLLNRFNAKRRTHDLKLRSHFMIEPPSKEEQPCQKERIHMWYGATSYRHACPLRYCQCPDCLGCDASAGGHGKFHVEMTYGDRAQPVMYNVHGNLHLENIDVIMTLIVQSSSCSDFMTSSTFAEIIKHLSQILVVCKSEDSSSINHVLYASVIDRILLFTHEKNVAAVARRGFEMMSSHRRNAFDLTNVFENLLTLDVGAKELFVFQDDMPSVRKEVHRKTFLPSRRIFAIIWYPPVITTEKVYPIAYLTPLVMASEDSTRLIRTALNLYLLHPELKIGKDVTVTRFRDRRAKQSSPLSALPTSLSTFKSLSFSSSVALEQQTPFIVTKLLVCLRLVDIPAISETNLIPYDGLNFHNTMKYLVTNFRPELDCLSQWLPVVIFRLDLAKQDDEMIAIKTYFQTLVKSHIDLISYGTHRTFFDPFSLNFSDVVDDVSFTFAEVSALHETEKAHGIDARRFVSSISLKKWMPGLSRPEASIVAC